MRRDALIYRRTDKAHAYQAELTNRIADSEIIGHPKFSIKRQGAAQGSPPISFLAEKARDKPSLPGLSSHNSEFVVDDAGTNLVVLKSSDRLCHE
ncbi:MAG: hypothetical protein R3F11_26640 [Verrucomicrobiales bacterium]